jgi:hypothetical protein
MNRLAAFALLCATALPVTAQTKILVAKSRVPTGVAFDEPRNFALPTACDEQGRSYVKLVKQGPGWDGLLLRLSGKGMREAEFDTTGALVNIFAVRPNGGVAMMHLDGATNVVDNFGPDGKRESAVRLEPPPTAFFPIQLAVFRSGEMLIGGLHGYRASTAIYDPTGHLVKQFVLNGDAEIERAIEVGDARYTHAPRENNDPVSRSVAITGDDGFVYLMRATSPATVYVISPAGEVIRKIVVSAPTDKGLPDFGIRVVKNRLTVKFDRECDSALSFESCRGTLYTVVDGTTGRRLADYGAGDTAGLLACYAPDPDRFFTFSMSADEHRLEIVETAPK